MAPTNTPPSSRIARKCMRTRTTERARQGMDSDVDEVPADERAGAQNGGHTIGGGDLG